MPLGGVNECAVDDVGPLLKEALLGPYSFELVFEMFGAPLNEALISAGNDEVFFTGRKPSDCPNSAFSMAA
jgi:hypothetical protein